jgi:hypothetical protein
MENWNSLLFACIASDVHPAISLVFLTTSLIVGNYILLNLLMAILLEGFDALEGKKEV